MGNNEHPEKQKLKECYESYSEYLSEILLNITNVLSSNLKLSSEPTFKKRVKSFRSYYKKVLRLKSGEAVDPKSLVCLSDMMGIRVICAFLEDIDFAVEQIKNLFLVVEVERKGADKNFREFGYESVHVLIKIPESCFPKREGKYENLEPLPNDAVCEIQIRTILQDAWAEVEHELIYKTEFTPLDIPLRRKLASLNASLSLADITFQEIRDYQTRLQREIAERRNSFYALADGLTDEIGSAAKNEPEQKIARVNPFVQGTIDELIVSAIHAHNQGHIDEAISTYSKIINAQPMPDGAVLAVIYKHRGMAYFAVNKYEEAMKDFDQSILYDPKAFRTYYYKGIVYYIEKKYQESIDCFSQSLLLNDFQAHTHFRRAMSYYKINDFDNAVEDLNAAMSLGIKESEIETFRNKLLKKFDMGM